MNGGMGARPPTARSATATGVPSSTTRENSPMNRPSSRLTMNEEESLTRIVVFFSALPVANAVARAASSVVSPGMTSRSGMTATGLKKWNPTTRSGWARPLAISVMDNELVLLSRTHCAVTTFSTSANTCCLTDSSSKTASMTTSASAKPSFEVEPVTRPLRKVALSEPIRPFPSSASTSAWT